MSHSFYQQITITAPTLLLFFLSGTMQVSQYAKKHSLTHSLLSWYQPSFIIFLVLLRSISFSLFSLHAWQSFCTTSVQGLFCLPLGLEPSTSLSYISSNKHYLIFAAHSFPVIVNDISLLVSSGTRAEVGDKHRYMSAYTRISYYAL